MGCDGIFDRLDSEQILDIAWATISTNKTKSAKIDSVHELNGQMTDAVMKEAALQ
jgi:serine/threonine protein phosphatase PrpC